MLISIQNYAKTIYIQEKLSVCIMSLCIQNDNYFKKSHSIILLSYAHRLIGIMNIYIPCDIGP